MQNLIYLILIALSAGAGYMAGGWSGKQAKQDLEDAKTVAVQTVAARDKLQADLDTALKAKKAEHDAELAQRQASFDATTKEFQAKLDASPGKAKSLQQASVTTTQRADQLRDKLATAKPDEAPSLRAEIARLEAQAKSQAAQARGNVCLKETVPAEMLAELRVEKL